MKRYKLTIIVPLVFMIFITPLNLDLEQLNNINNIDNEIIIEPDLESSDVAGSDLYAEKINVFVAGNKSLIKQSLFTNDTNILSQFDSNDPAFYKCNIIITTTNGINPSIFPRILTESEVFSPYTTGFNNFAGFLFYDKDVPVEDAEIKAKRALEIIKRKFKIDLIMVNVSEPNFYPFVGACPDFNCFFQELMINFPMDGYWKALDVQRLTSEAYLKSNHISSSFMLLNSLDFFDGEYNLSTDQINFNLDSLDLSFLQTIGLENLLEQFDAIIENFGDFFNLTISEEEFQQFLEIFSSFTIVNDSHYTTISIQYEGLDEGIQKVGDNQYRFNLWDALGYHDEPLAPSEKIYIALAGAFMSEINIEILCTDIIDATPMNFKFSDYLLEQIALLFYLAGIDFNTQDLKDYSFDLFWVSETGKKRSYVKPVNLQDPADIINILTQLGFQGFNFIPTGIINPIGDFSVTYNISQSEPNLILKKELIGGNASFGAFRNFTYHILAENIGNLTVWGVPTHIPFELNDIFLLLTLGNQELANEFQDTLWEIVRIEYPNQYVSLEDFFNFDEDPRIFYFDSFGTGVFDTFYPDISNLTNLYPYNEDMEHVIDVLITGYPQLATALGVLGLTPREMKDLFTNSYSVWNDNNWKLEPREFLSYEISNYSIENLDSFTSFYTSNFTIQSNPPTPEIISGKPLYGTTPEMALSSDEDSWIIGSIEKFLEQKVEINFIFKNESVIDFANNKLQKISFIVNISASFDLESSNFRIFDFETEEFRDMSQFLESNINNTWTFSIINQNRSLDWLFYPLEQNDLISILKIICTNSEEFNISINDLDIEFSDRNINFNNDPGSRIVFGSITGNVQFERRSNSIPLSTYSAASIIVSSYLNSYSNEPGDLITLTIDFMNIGSEVAKNLTISMLIPGIIDNINEFKLIDKNLSYYCAEIAPSEELSVNLSFYVPNSISLSEISIVYNNPKPIEGGNSTKVYSYTNELFISAPVNYEEFFPFVRVVRLDYIGTELHPSIGEIFNLTISLKNLAPYNFKITDLNISVNDHFGDLKNVGIHSFYFKDLNYEESISFNITLKKKGWKGYYYPPINFIQGSESRTIQIFTSSSIILGKINFSIIKSVNKDQIEIGERLTVFIEVQNTGTISVENLRVNDMLSFSQLDFSLIEGKLINLINSLGSGEKEIFNYTIEGKRQTLVTLNPSTIKFYYLQEREVTSRSNLIKIITPKITQFYYIGLPVFIGIVVFIIYFWQTKKYKRKRKDYQRAEMNIFELGSREAILKIEHTLGERLNSLANKSKKEYTGNETKQ
ncbi:MAG: hypothetical protein ACFFEY_00585 [Candidatus Thorarchaeota archaeon]